MRGGHGPDLSGIGRIQARMRAIESRFDPDRPAEAAGRGCFVEVLDRARTGNADRPAASEPEKRLLPEKASTSADGTFLDGLIREKSARYGVDEALVRSVIEMESGGNPRAVSKAGARGLMQLMPGTARMLGVEDSFDPEQNVDGGVRYLRQMLERYGGDEARALAAYHSGPGTVDRYGGVPPFPAVRKYVECVGAMTRRRREGLR